MDRLVKQFLLMVNESAIDQMAPETTFMSRVRPFGKMNLRMVFVLSSSNDYQDELKKQNSNSKKHSFLLKSGKANLNFTGELLSSL